MSLNTSLKGRLRNTNLPKSHALFPLYKAVVSSIHSIDERIKNDQECRRVVRFSCTVSKKSHMEMNNG